jgi:ubiquinone/menaquinone biosynthesis C-methylase UbiE
MTIPTRPTTADYALSSETDRDRLYLQFDLYKGRFREAFTRALAKADVNAHSAWRALDVACGEGLYAADLVERYPFASVVGFDRDAEAIATASMAFAARARLRFHLADVHQPLAPIVGENFDVAYLQFGLAHFKSGAAALAQVFQVLRPGGAIMLLDPTEQFIAYPHPSWVALVSAFRKMWETYGTYAAGDVQEKMLHETGFVDIATEDHRYVLGGGTKVGQANLANCVELFHSGREAMVERAKTISATDFDEHFAQLRAANDPQLEGTTWFRLALARKP